MMILSVLIPAYNEERTIGDLLRELVGFDLSPCDAQLEIIVCDDGSNDGTAAEVRRVQRDHDGIRLLSHDQNRGKGAAIRTAVEFASGDYVLIQSANLEYRVADYPALIAAARAGADVIYGSRFLARRYPLGMHPSDYAANKILAATSNLLFGHNITDEATCFKMFRTEVLRHLDLQCERFEFCSEVTAKLGLLGIPIVEVPVGYLARDAKGAKKVRWTDGVEAISVLLRCRLRAPVRQLSSR